MSSSTEPCALPRALWGTPPPHYTRILVCCPHAGAGASVYAPLRRASSSGTWVISLQAPGRENRLREDPIESLGQLVAEFGSHLNAVLDAPFDIVGHSLGALTAFELARWLRRAGGPQPERLFVSGRGAPHLPSDGEDISRRDSAFFVRLLRDFGGTPSRVIEDPRMAEMIIPALRADLVMHQRYVYRYDEPLDTSITAFAALDDERAQPIDVEQWGVHTAATFRRIDHPGGHFAIIEDPSPLVAQLEGDAR